MREGDGELLAEKGLNPGVPETWPALGKCLSALVSDVGCAHWGAGTTPKAAAAT